MDPAKAAFIGEKSIAIVGISARSGFANSAYKDLKRKGYRVFGVGRTASAVEGDRCYHSLDELPEKVGGVLAVVPPAETVKIVADCARLGIGQLWMQQGSESPGAIRAAEAAGLRLVHHACILMYAQPGGGHKLHAWVLKLFGKW